MKSQPSRWAIVAVLTMPIALGAGFAWAAGWIGPTRIGGSTIVDVIEASGGKHAGYRRAHAKGLCFSGHFLADGAGSQLSRSAILESGRHQVIGRLSLGGGNPLASDGRNTLRSMALRIEGPGGQEWRMAMNHAPIFPVATREAFVELQQASLPDPMTGKPDPARMEAYLAQHPETKAFQDYMANNPLPDSFSTSSFFSANTFRFLDGAGRAHTVRWTFLPEAPFGELDKVGLDQLPANYLFDEFLERVTAVPQRWQMVATLAAPGDVTNNVNAQWSDTRKTVSLGTLTIDKAQPEEEGACRDITFDPTILPDGVVLSDDPLPAARSAAYAASLRRRAGEGAGPSAVGQAAGSSL